MGITTATVEPGIVTVTVDYPKVNAIPSRGWFELADAILAAGNDPSTHVVILRAEGRGFNAGADIKEMQATDGFTALIDTNRGCFEAFSAVYRCKVPVIAAVNGFCLGGGIGLVGNADVIVAADDAVFSVPEVDRGALGTATHLQRLVPQHVMRRMFYTAAKIDAKTLHHYGSIHEVVPRAELDEAALRVARDIAAKDTRVIRSPRRPSTSSIRRTSSRVTAWSRASHSNSTLPESPTNTVMRSSRPESRRGTNSWETSAPPWTRLSPSCAVG